MGNYSKLYGEGVTIKCMQVTAFIATQNGWSFPFMDFYSVFVSVLPRTAHIQVGFDVRVTVCEADPAKGFTLNIAGMTLN